MGPRSGVRRAWRVATNQCELGRRFLFLNSGILQEEAGKLGGGPAEDVLTVVGLTLPEHWAFLRRSQGVRESGMRSLSERYLGK